MYFKQQRSTIDKGYRMTQLFKILLLALVLLLPQTIFANEQKRFIPVYVNPYYTSAVDGKSAPKVKVNKRFDTLLASSKQEDILHVEKMTQDSPDMVTPMTMMVLAIRLYDVGLRDRSVFWFYVAKDRFFTLAGVANTKHRSLIEVENAIKSFATLTGPFFNSYAFCDISKQQQIRKESLQWVINHPYKAIYMKNMPLLPGSIDKNLQKTIDNLQNGIEKSKAYFSNKEKLDEFYKQRKLNKVDEQFCW